MPARFESVDHEAAAVEALESIPRDVSPELAVQVAQAAATLALVAEVRAFREALTGRAG